MELESGIFDIPMDWTVQLDSSSEDEEIAWTVTDLIGFYEERIRNARQNWIHLLHKTSIEYAMETPIAMIASGSWYNVYRNLNQ